MKKKSGKNIAIVSAFFAAGIAVYIMTLCLCNANSVESKSGSAETEKRPMIIWWGRFEDGPETLHKAISSGIFSHVMLRCLHEFDQPASKVFADPKFQKMLKSCKEHGVKVIWTRWLYPVYRHRDFIFEQAFSTQYYVERILQIKKEAKQIGVDLVAFDAEPYANCPITALKKRELSETEFKTMDNAISMAVKLAGQVDFIIPAGGTYKSRYFYNCTCRLGKMKISEYTYYDVPSAHSEKIAQIRPFDIKGVFVDITKKNKYNPKLPLFTPKEILERQNLWAHKKGLFIYTANKERAILVAEEFSKIRAISPVRDSNSIR